MLRNTRSATVDAVPEPVSLRVLYVTNLLEMGGIETNLRLLVRELTARGHQVAVAARPGVLSHEIRELGAIEIPLRVAFRVPSELVRDAWSLRSAINSFSPDVIHVFSASAASLVYGAQLGWTNKGRRRPVISTVMGLEASPDERAWITYSRAFLTSLGTLRVIVVSPAIERVMRRMPIRARRLVPGQVVGVELPTLKELPQRRAKARETLGIDAETPLVMTVGTLAPRKSHELFIQAAARLIEEGSTASFVIIGEGPLRDELEQDIAARGIGRQVLLFGEYPNAADLLWGADVCVRPGIVEGFVGITVLEAQARLVPVVSFETEDVKMAIEHGVSGLLVPKGDVSLLAQTVGTLLGNAPFASTLSVQGRLVVEQRFGLSAVVDSLLETYRSLTAYT